MKNNYKGIVEEREFRQSVRVALWVIALAQIFQLGLMVADLTKPWAEYFTR